jgi:hypothetical protein
LAFGQLSDHGGDDIDSIARQFFDSQGFDGQLNALARRLSAGNISIYPVDARGVTSIDLGPEDTISPIAAGLNWGSQGPAGTMDAASSHAVADPDASFNFTMHEIADWTVGRAFLGSNDISGEIRSAFADGQQGYLLGFYPQGVWWDEKFHELRIAIRRSGVKLRARKGYFASVDSTDDHAAQAQQLALAEESPLNSTSVLFSVRADRKTANKVIMVRTGLEISANQFTFAPLGDTMMARVKLVFVQKDRAQQPLEKLERMLVVRLSPAQYDQALA